MVASVGSTFRKLGRVVHAKSLRDHLHASSKWLAIAYIAAFILVCSALFPCSRHLWLLAVGVLLCSMTVKVCATNGTAQLVACDYRPTEDDFDLVVRFCPTLNYTVVLECSVTDTPSLMWKSPHFDDVLFVSDESCTNNTAEKGEEGFTFYSIRKEIYGGMKNSYVSQLRVSTSYLRDLINVTQVNVTCQSSTNEKRMSFIRISGNNQVHSEFVHVQYPIQVYSNLCSRLQILCLF